MGSHPRVAVLQTGRALAPVRLHYGDFDSWFKRIGGPGAEYLSIPLYSGAKIPSMSESDGWIITGSPDSVLNPHNWIQELKRSIREAAERSYPVLGVCFGHQLLGVALGGRVEVNRNGWELGSTEIRLTSAGRNSKLFRDLPGSFPVYASHGEVVSSPPPGAVILADNEMGIQAFQYADTLFGVQFHPEFDRDITQEYVRLRSPDIRGVITNDVGDAEVSHDVLRNYIQLILV